jgi:hypothetical protein
MLLLLHPDVQFTNIFKGNVNVRTSGISEFEKLAKQSALMFKEREQKIVSIKENGDVVYVQVEFNAILAADMSSDLKTGDKISLIGKSEYKFMDDLIYSITDES